MKHTLLIFIVFIFTFANLGFSQTGKVIEDFKPSEVNQSGKAFPQVNSEGRVRVQIAAPDAKYVQLDIGGVQYALVKDDNGVCTGQSAPQDEDIHNYHPNAAAASVPNPRSKYF